MTGMRRKMWLATLAAVTASAGLAADTTWQTTVTESDRAQTIGNPEAEVRLSEFVSYTCPHCANFTIRGEPPLRSGYIDKGDVKLEIRSVIRNELDVVATLLVQCGPRDRFISNHKIFMLTQRSWLPIAQSATQDKIARWTSADQVAGRQAIAADLGFYALMESRGYARNEVDECLADSTKAARLRANSAADLKEFGVTSTPSFAIDGQLLNGVHEWQALEAAIKGHSS